MEGPISLLIGLCVMSCLAQGRTLADRGVNRYFQRYPISQKDDYGERDDSIPTIIILQDKDEILDALLAVNKEELAQQSGSATATEYLPGLDGIFRSDRSNGKRMVYMNPDKLNDKKTGKNLRTFGWWLSWWKGLDGNFYGTPNNGYSSSQSQSYYEPEWKL